MTKALITVGISASGKSTYAKEWLNESPSTRVEVNRDNIRRSIVEENGEVFTWAKWNWKNEKRVTEIALDAMVDAATQGKDIIVSDTNLNQGRLDNLISSLKDKGYSTVEVKEFPVTIEEAWKRDAARADGVGHSTIARQYDDWLKYKGHKQYVADTNTPSAVLVDLDGSLAHMNGKRGAFEWDKVHVDDVDSAVREIVNLLHSSGKIVIVLSGRDGICQPNTTDWLHSKDVKFDRLIMREAGDMRKDTVVKEEIFWRDIAANYNVQLVIDDRPSVCRMWGSIGVKVFQVGNPHIEF